MHLPRTLLVTALVGQTVAIPLNSKNPYLRSSLSLIERAYFPPECVDDDATEAQGCYTLQDASNNNVRFVLDEGQSFKDRKNIGQGWFGQVTRCVLKNEDLIAVWQEIIVQDDGEERNEDSFNLLKDLEQPGNDHIVKAIARGKVENRPALAMELGPDGTIKSRIKEGQYQGKDNQDAMINVGNQILDGLVYMHDKNIAHGDIHEGNVVFQGDTAIIIDFDFGTKDKDVVDHVAHGDGGSAAPEGWLRPSTGRRINPYANDVWTTAAMFIFMTTGKKLPPVYKEDMRVMWENDNADVRADKIKERWPEFSEDFRHLLGNLLCKEDQRLDIHEFQESFSDIKIYC